jgi:DNA polymerase-3 subunit epsilon
VDEGLLIHGFASDGLDASGANEAIANLLGTPKSGIADDRTTSASPDLRVISADEITEVSSPAFELADNMPLSEMEFVALDVETTGVMPVIDHIVEMAAVRFRLDGTVLRRWQTLVDPGRSIPSEATAVHGITNDMVRGQLLMSQAAAEFTDFLSGSPALLIAHNATFDLGFVSAACLVHRLSLPDVIALCTLELARARLHGVGNHRLETLAAHYRVADRVHHRAGDDAALLGSVFRELIRQTPIISTTAELQTLLEPLTWQDGGVFAVPHSTRVAPIINAIEQRCRISILYEMAEGQLCDISVSPLALIHSLGREYLVALCHRSESQKTYRLDRIRRVRT